MGATASSPVARTTSFSSTSVSPNAKQKEQEIQALTDAIKSGNQIILEKDVREKVSEISKVFEDFNKNDHQGLLEHIDKLNDTLQGTSKIAISDQVKNALMSFHKAVLANLNTAGMPEAKQREAFIGEMKKPTSEIFQNLSKHFGKELEDKKNELINQKGIVESPELKTNITTIMNSVQGLKVKYKFFEYKYIEMNIFLILFIEHVYKSLERFITNVVAFNQQRDLVRENLIKDTFSLMMNILTSADLQINPDDFDYITKLMEQLRTHMQTKNNEMEEKMRGMVEVTTDNLAGFINALSSATKDGLYQQLQGQQGQQRGGFVRDGSKFPQAFYELDGLDLPPNPGSGKMAS